MKTKLFLITLLLITFSATKSIAQKLVSEDWEVSLENFDTQKMEFFGKTQTIYVGTVKVKKGKKKLGEYRFYFPEMEGKLTHLTVRDMSDQILEPRLYYNTENKTFTYNQGKENEKTEAVLKGEDTKELVLSGVMIWMKQNK